MSKSKVEICQKIVRATIEAAVLPGKHLTTGGAIAFLEDTKKYLERCALGTAPEDYLDDEEEEGESESCDRDRS